jgi:hypothetical protein
VHFSHCFSTLIFVLVTLQLRIYALYDLNKHLLVSLGVAFAASFSAALAIHVHALRQIRATSHAVPGLPFCVPHGVPARYWTVWVPILAFEVLLLALAVHRAAADDGGPRRIVHARRLVDILVRDSVAYFFVCVRPPAPARTLAHAPAAACSART